MNTTTIKNFNSKIEPYYALIGMIIFFVGGMIAVYSFFFKDPKLSVRIDKQEINYPATINQKFQTVFSYLTDSTRNATVKSNAAEVYDYLLNTNNFWTITLKNETKSTLSKIRIKISGVSDLNAYNISSPFLLNEERDKVAKSVSFQESSGLIYIDNIEELPSKVELKLYLWGKMSPLVMGENVYVTYEGGDAKPAYSTVVTGFKAYVVNYIFEIFLLFLLTIILVYRNIIKKNTSNVNP